MKGMAIGLISLGGKKVSIAALTILCVALLAASVVAPAMAKPRDDGDEQGNGQGHGKGQGKGNSNQHSRGWENSHNTPIPVESVVNVTASGTAYNITNTTRTFDARVTFNATIEKSSWGRAKLEVTEGSLKIGNTTYTIEDGKGLIALRSGKIVVHLRVTAEGKELPIVLKGELVERKITELAKGSSISLNFTKPQSKLVGQFFLDLTGSLERVE